VAGIGDLRRMAVEYEYALGTHVGDHYKIVAQHHHPGITTDRAWPSVAQRLHLGEANGCDPDQLLPAAGRLGGFTGSRSTAQVLVYRLDLLLARAQGRHTGPPPPVPSWLAAAPPVHLTPPWNEYLPGRYEEMDRRISTLVDEAQANRAGWLDRIGDEASPVWGEAARQVVAYRTVYDIRGDDPLGPIPDQPGRQLQAWQAAHHAITACTPPPSTPSAAERLLATLTDADRESRFDDDHRNDSHGGPGRHL